MSAEDQSVLPPSFLALYLDRRQRLTAPRGEVLQRYELCEDLAQQLEAPTRGAALQGLAEDVVLRRCRDGLADPSSGLRADEAHWVACRLAELLGWPMPPAPAVDEAPA